MKGPIAARWVLIKMMNKRYLTLMAVMIAGIFQSCKDRTVTSNSTTSAMNADSTKFSSLPAGKSTADTTFAAKAAISGMAEVALGMMATNKGADSRVRNLGKMMVMDHGKANVELMTIAKAENIDLPIGLDAKHQAKGDSLNKLSDGSFDKAYLHAMVEGHQQALALMNSEASGGKDARLKAFAAKNALVVRMHLERILTIQSGLKYIQ